MNPAAASHRFVLCLFPVALLLAGCATQVPTQSGFLGTYGDLREATGPELGAARVARVAPSQAALVRYRSIYIDPVVVSAPDLDPEQQMSVRKAAEDALRAELGKSWPLAVSPDQPGTLRLRTAVTAVTKAMVPLNVALTAVGVPLSNGGVSTEMEAIDAKSGSRIAAMTWASEKRFSDPVGFYIQTAHARGLMPDFAKDVAALLARD